MGPTDAPPPEPAEAEQFSRGAKSANGRSTLVIACGALAREVLAVRRGPLAHFDVTCLPAQLHNRPERIPGAVRAKIRANRNHYDEILCLYGDCGTGGELDRVLGEEGVRRVAGAHCYEFYAGAADFAALQDEELGTFYLTDFLARHFETLVVKGLGLDRHPQLRDVYFANYRRLVYLQQFDDPATTAKARAAAERLGLAFELRRTGLGGLGDFLRAAANFGETTAWPT